MPKSEIKEKRSKVIENKASYLFENGLYCSEAILKAYNDELELGLDETSLKMATAFGAGIGGAKCCCGSLTGAVLVLSALKGRTNPDESIDNIFFLASELHRQFVVKYGAACCRALTRKVEWNSPEHHQYCDRFVRGAVEILEELLNKKPEDLL